MRKAIPQLDTATVTFLKRQSNEQEARGTNPEPAA